MKVFYAIPIVLCAACGGQVKEAGQDAEEPVAVEVEQDNAAEDSVAAFVTRMYADVISAANKGATDCDARYFSRDMQKAFAQGVSAASETDEWEQSWPYGHYWFGTMGIDNPTLLGVEVTAVSATRAHAVMELKPFDDMDFSKHLGLELVWEDSVWRVDDIVDGYYPSLRRSVQDFMALKEEHTTDAAIAALSASNPVEAIRAIYHDFEFMYRHDYLGSEERQKYMTQDFNRLLRQAADSAEVRDDLFLDWDPWIASQDYDEVSLTDAELLRRTDSSARVLLSISLGGGNETRVTATLKRERNRWRVDDLLNDSTSIRQLCEEYIKAN